MLRPSTSASCEVARVPVAPRVVRLMSRAETWVTLRPGTARSRSPMLVAGEFRIVSFKTRLTAAGAFTSSCSEREAETTTCSLKVTGRSSSCGSAGGAAGAS